MKTNDAVKNITELRQNLVNALKSDDETKVAQAMDDMIGHIGADIKADFEAYQQEVTASKDVEILNGRGCRQLTSAEQKYYNGVIDAMKSDNYKQALSNLNLQLPETVIDEVFTDLRTNHPLLAKIDFKPANARIKFLINTNGRELATWGKLCDEIIKELTGGLKEVETGLCKVSAFLPVCKSMLEFGAAWLDRFVRETLAEALANALEAGIVDGTGKDMPIGMTRDVSETAVVVGGVYPHKEQITIGGLDAVTLGNLIGRMAVDENGKARAISNLVLIVNPTDYYTKVNPAIFVLATDGTYKNILPFPVDVIQSAAVEVGTAIFGMANRYAAFAGASTEGIVEYSDHYHFLEDERVYLIKAFANGLPKDNNSFVYLNIEGLAPANLKIVAIDDRTLSADATLARIKIGNLALDPTFDPDVDTYEADTTSATNVITATPNDAGASVEITVGDVTVANGTAATWETGENTVTITVTAENGVATETYTVTVTKA